MRRLHGFLPLLRTGSLLAHVRSSEPAYLLVCSDDLGTPGMRSPVNAGAVWEVAARHHAELQALTSRVFRHALGENKVRLTTYRELIRTRGLSFMARPEL